MATHPEKSGVHLTAADSGWPTGNVAVEPDFTKDGTGADPHPDAVSVAAGLITDDAA